MAQSFGELFGQGLGSGLSAGISQFADFKLRGLLQKAQKQQSYETLRKAQFSPQEADFLSSFSPEQQLQLIPLLDQMGGEGSAQQSSISASLGGEAPVQQDLGQLMSGLQGKSAADLLTSPVNDLISNQLRKSKIQGLGGLPTEVTPRQEQPTPAQVQRAIEEQQAEPIEQPRKETIAEQLKKPRRTAADIKAERETEKQNFKTTQKYVDKITTDYDAAKFAQPRLNKMKKLVKEGGLPISSFYKIAKNIEDHLTPTTGTAAGATLGGVIGGLAGAPTGGVLSPATAAIGTAVGGGLGAAASFLGPVLSQIQRTTSPNTEKFEKLSAQFLRGAKDIFGGRFTNEEMKAYLDMIPKLSNTDKGKLDIIEDFELFNKAANLKYKAMQQIIKENGGKRPYNLQELVDERVRPQLDELSDIFKEDLVKYATEGA